MSLNKLSNLQELRLENTKVTEDGVKALQAVLPKCKIVSGGKVSIP